MTMRYLSTITAEEALRINQAILFEDEAAAPPQPPGAAPLPPDLRPGHLQCRGGGLRGQRPGGLCQRPPGQPRPSSFFTTHTLPVKCNESLRDDYCRWFSIRERNCEGPLWAERYAHGYLFRCLKDLYQGEIVITGEPAMKPYDPYPAEEVEGGAGRPCSGVGALHGLEDLPPGGSGIRGLAAGGGRYS